MQTQFMVLNSHAVCACARLCKYFPHLSPRMKLKNWLNTEAFISTYSGVKATKASSTFIQSWISLISSGKESHMEYWVRKPPDKSLKQWLQSTALQFCRRLKFQTNTIWLWLAQCYQLHKGHKLSSAWKSTMLLAVTKNSISSKTNYTSKRLRESRYGKHLRPWP